MPAPQPSSSEHPHLPPGGHRCSPLLRLRQTWRSEPGDCSPCNGCFLTLGRRFWLQRINLSPSNGGFACGLNVYFLSDGNHPSSPSISLLMTFVTWVEKSAGLSPTFLGSRAWFALGSFSCLALCAAFWNLLWPSVRVPGLIHPHFKDQGSEATESSVSQGNHACIRSWAGSHPPPRSRLRHYYLP